eukprot:Pgem_evm1s15075
MPSVDLKKKLPFPHCKMLIPHLECGKCDLNANVFFFTTPAPPRCGPCGREFLKCGNSSTSLTTEAGGVTLIWYKSKNSIKSYQ